MISERDIIIRILVGALLGAAVGLERELNDQPAGLRTHIILVVGATLAMVLSVNLGHLFARPGLPADPARLAAQVISGIGFLGAGAILRFGYNVKGLTTATSLWTMAIVGMAVGAGYYLVGLITTSIMLIVLVFLHIFKDRFVKAAATRYLTLEIDYSKGVVRSIRKIINNLSDSVSSFTIQRSVKNKRVRIQAVAKFARDQKLEHLIDTISEVEGVRNIKIE